MLEDSESQSGESAKDQTSESPNDRLRNLASILVADGKPLSVSEKSKATTAEHQELESGCRVK